MREINRDPRNPIGRSVVGDEVVVGSVFARSRNPGRLPAAYESDMLGLKAVVDHDGRDGAVGPEPCMVLTAQLQQMDNTTD